MTGVWKFLPILNRPEVRTLICTLLSCTSQWKKLVDYIPMQWGSGNIESLDSQVKAQGAKTLLVRIHALYIPRPE
jgi:hypothetical protein